MSLKLKHRLTREEGGFSLIELLVVIVILGVLVAIAVPAYLGLKNRSQVAAAKANVRAAVPDMEMWAADHTNGYTAATTANLKSQYDPGLVATLATTGLTKTKYCLYATVGSKAAHYSGPGGVITTMAANSAHAVCN